MILLPISRGIWTVCAVVDHRGKCQVIDELIRLGNGNRSEAKLADKISYLLEERVPNERRGPSALNVEASKHLSGNVFEFRRGQNFGPKIRVLYFFGNSKTVICTFCFLKRDKTPQNKINQTESLREQYRKDLASRNIQVLGDN